MPNKPNDAVIRSLALKWHIPEAITTIHATNLVIQSDGNDLYLSFFETIPPLIIGSPEEVIEQAQSIGSVTAECVARMVMPMAKMSEILEAFQDMQNRIKTNNLSGLIP